ncbi:MAG TPA: replication-associated recombination protein A [Fimbriimonadaceae bacterium]|jgi:putative ATPase
MQEDLFGSPSPTVSPQTDQPLAARMRPRTFDEFVGQAHIIGPDAALRRAVENGSFGSLIFWGPPGVGKTTLAELIASVSKAHFSKVSAVSAGVADLRKIIEEARARKRLGQKTILFIDEIHRFNKSQQDAILPVVEDGTVTLIGATTENPSFEVNSALISRSRVYVLNALEDEETRLVIRAALTDPKRGLGELGILLDPDAEDAMVNLANGDARSALNMLEMCAQSLAPGSHQITLEQLKSAVQRRSVIFDKSGEMHYDLISALHKTVRGSDVDASLYWLARMLEGGEDPLYLARRLVRMATEDIGLADTHALPLAMAAQQAVHFMGMPEGALALAEITAYLAAAPKSNAIYVAFKRAQADVQETRNDPVPHHLRNAPTNLMKDLGYGKGYKYAHDFEEGYVYQQNLPESLEGKVYYEPTDRGEEKTIAERLARVRGKAEEARKKEVG